MVNHWLPSKKLTFLLFMIFGSIITEAFHTTVQADNGKSSLDISIPIDDFKSKYGDRRQLQKPDFEIFPYELQEYLHTLEWENGVHSGFTKLVGSNALLVIVNENRVWASAARGAVLSFKSYSAVLPRKDFSWRPLVLPYVTSSADGVAILSTEIHPGIFTWEEQKDLLELTVCGEESISEIVCRKKYKYKISAGESQLLEVFENIDVKGFGKRVWKPILKNGKLSTDVVKYPL